MRFPTTSAPTSLLGDMLIEPLQCRFRCRDFQEASWSTGCWEPHLSLLVSCPVNSSTKSFEFGEDGVGGGRPH